MTQSTRSPATSATTPCTLVAGLDQLTRRERDADHLALHIADTLRAHSARDLTIATHWAQIGVLRHVALSMHAAVADPTAIGAVLHDLTVRIGDPFGLLFGERYDGQPELRPLLADVMLAHTTGRSGRAVVFPGVDALVGTLTVGQALERSAIDRIRILAGDDANAATPLVTRDFVRPRWHGGQLGLDVQPAVGGTVVPFETPTPTPCCANHA